MLRTRDDAPTDLNGQCTIVFTSFSAGFTTGRAWSTLTVGGVELFRETDGTGRNSDPAEKARKDEGICLVVTDEEGIDKNLRRIQWAAEAISDYNGDEDFVTPGEWINDETREGGPEVPAEMGNPLFW